MGNKLLYHFRSGKNPKFVYYIVNYLRLLTPKWACRLFLHHELKSGGYGRNDYAYIRDRVDYYNKLQSGCTLPAGALPLKAHHLKKPKVYFFDTYMYLRFFPQNLRWGFCPGDVTFVPAYPSVVKSRPITGDNANSVVMKLDKVRHFIFVDDKKAFTGKKDMVIFRGKVIGKPARTRFMEMYVGNPMCDLGAVDKDMRIPEEWRHPKKTIREHLDYKFIMALEGNDVASNLKWVMSSNSIAVMPRPTYETWFMEGTLLPDYHYIEIRPDFADLEEKLNYYITHPAEAEKIIEHAHEYVAQFRDRKRERLISFLVLDKYFRMTGQAEKGF